MQLVHIYLNFAGNTEEAFKFYEKVFGTRIAMKQTFGDTPFVKGVPDGAKNKLMHIQLPITVMRHKPSAAASMCFSVGLSRAFA